VAHSGLLIINADDWGLDRAPTDAILECFRAGAITSATAMVWMSDSDRAAAIARDHHFPLGLHLNLIEPFTAAPESIARRQRDVADRFRSRPLRALSYDPRLASGVDRCIADQLARFEELYGRPPTHVDGHRHMHISLNAVFASSLRAVGRYRAAFTFPRAESPAPKRVMRAAQNALIRRRFATTRYFFSIRTLHPALGGSGIDAKLALARTSSVEVMVHPGEDDEHRLLLGESWLGCVAQLPTGSYMDLPAG
jgi:chitin disaccharide deacetylase